MSEKERIYINLTAGLLSGLKGNYIRIQSSHIESKQFDRLFYGLSDDLLFRLARGEKCVIVDCSRNDVGKVIKIGVPVIKYILNRIWFNKEECEAKYLSKDYLRHIYKQLSRQTKAKLKYFKKFLNTKEIKLEGISIKVDKEKYEEKIKE